MRLRSLWPARILVAGLGALVLLLVGAVVAQGASSAARAAALRHQLVAERLFDGMERELTDFLDDEEMRPFIEYRPVDGLVEQRPDFVVGYFQIDPEGQKSNPHSLDEPAAERVALACEPLDGWGNQTAEPRTTTMKVAVDVPTPRPVGTVASSPSTKAAPARNFEAQQQVTLPPENQLNNAWAPRMGRGSTVQKVSPKQLSTYSEEPVQQAVVEPPVEPEAQPEPEPTTRRMWVPVEVPVPDAATEVVDVVVSPFVVTYPDPDTLRMHRTVRIGPRSWVQGVVVDVPTLQAHLAQSALDGTDLGAYIDVHWDRAPASRTGSYRAPADYAFEYTFGDPFQPFQATARLHTLPGDANTTIEGLVQLLALLLLAVAMLGLFAVYRMIAVTLVYAQQRADFVSAVTHELKSPLTSIRMYSEMLETGMVPGPERQLEYYTTIRLESERLGRLVDDVLAFSRVDRGLTVASGDTGRVRDVIDDVVRLLEPVAQAAGAKLVVSIEDGVGDTTIDRDALAHVLTNLLDNAVKFSADAADRTVELRAQRDGERVVVVVRDHGPGVPRQLLGRIFEPFFRGERELTRKTKGTGIGLALVQSMVERLEGAIDARNHPEGGFEVTVALPA